MRILGKYLTIAGFHIIALTFGISCSQENITANYYGKYHGTVNQKMTNGTSIINQPYDMVIDISAGDNVPEIKVLFGSWLTKANLNENSFIIQPTTFPSQSIITSGDGNFGNNQVTIRYIQLLSSSITAEYSGTLQRF